MSVGLCTPLALLASGDVALARLSFVVTCRGIESAMRVYVVCTGVCMLCVLVCYVVCIGVLFGELTSLAHILL
jgi:hypothetical protein